jgi:hypothetical protein
MVSVLFAASCGGAPLNIIRQYIGHQDVGKSDFRAYPL